VLQALPNVYPADAWDSIQRQRLADRIVFTRSDAAAWRTFNFDEFVVPKLPTPHPLDFCWWFDAPTVAFLVSEIERLSVVSAHVVLLGAPTVFEFARRALQRDVSLVDCDDRVVRSFSASDDAVRVLRADVTCDIVSLPSAELVVADPPWYPFEMRGFLWTARHLCERGAYVVISVPPKGTRPGVEDEWRILQEWSAELGLLLQKYEPGVLSYVTPPFEENALAAAKVPVPPTSWRRGDLAIFQCVDECRKPRPQTQPKAIWQERMIGDVRIRIKTDGVCRDWADPTLHQVADTDTFPTVSARDARRTLAAVWTSGNRAFACEAPEIALEILEAIANGSETVACVERALRSHLSIEAKYKVNQTEARLRTIIETERTELCRRKERHGRVDVITR
jgi:hypothetical protein